LSSIADFQNQILSIQPKGINVFGTYIPGFGGASMSARVGSTEADVVRKLQKNVHELSSLIKSQADYASIKEQKKIVEADLRMCNVVGLVSDKDLDSLITSLNEL
jgi:hypothetical protein